MVWGKILPRYTQNYGYFRTLFQGRHGGSDVQEFRELGTLETSSSLTLSVPVNEFQCVGP